jgi:hypothetical protein
MLGMTHTVGVTERIVETEGSTPILNHEGEVGEIEGANEPPEAMAKRAVARKLTTPQGHRVKLVLTLFLPHDVAEYITARAIREGKNVAGLGGGDPHGGGAATREMSDDEDPPLLLLALRVTTRSRAAFFGCGGFHFVILRQADEFLDAPSELRDTLGSDIEEAGVFEMLVRLHQGIGRHDSRCRGINDDLIPEIGVFLHGDIVGASDDEEWHIRNFFAEERQVFPGAYTARHDRVHAKLFEG